MINYWLGRKQNTFYYILNTVIGKVIYQLPSNIVVKDIVFHNNYNTQAYYIKNSELTLIPTPNSVFKITLKYEEVIP
jgi:hypothetical protein